MSEQPRTPYLGRYALVLLAAIVGIAVLRVAMIALFDLQLSAGGLALIPSLVAAMHCGQRWAIDRGTAPTSQEAWRWALVAGAVFLAVQILLAPLVLISLGGPVSSELVTIVALGLVFFTAIAIFTHRFFLVMGARGVLKNPGK